MKRITLTDEEWVSIIDMNRDGLPLCCANVSDLRDELIAVIRNGGFVASIDSLKLNIQIVLDGHDNLPLIEKIKKQL